MEANFIRNAPLSMRNTLRKKALGIPEGNKKLKLITILGGAVARIMRRQLQNEGRVEVDEYIDGMAKVHVGTQIQDLPDSVVESISARNIRNGRARRIVESALARVRVALSGKNKL